MNSQQELRDGDVFDPGTINSGPRCDEFCPYLHHDDKQTQGQTHACLLFHHFWYHYKWPPPRCRECQVRYPYGADIEVKAKPGGKT